MAGIGVSEAARLVGRDVSTLHRMMKSGRLSYTTDSSGRRRLDPAELGRLFDLAAMHGNGATQSMDLPQGDAVQVMALLREAVQCRDAMLADLQRRLDASEAERRAVQERLTAILIGPINTTNKGNPIMPAPSAASGLAIPRPPWWRRWFR
jgi:hypothetical protein